RTRRLAETDQAARRERALALDDQVSDAVGKSAPRKRSRADGRRGRTRCRIRPVRAGDRSVARKTNRPRHAEESPVAAGRRGQLPEKNLLTAGHSPSPPDAGLFTQTLI